MVLRDRNHPSVVIWGIGNEIPEVGGRQGRRPREANGYGSALAGHHAAADARLSGNDTAPNSQAVFSQLDITGYNYSLEKTYRRIMPRYPIA